MIKLNSKCQQKCKTKNQNQHGPLLATLILKAVLKLKNYIMCGPSVSSTTRT